MLEQLWKHYGPTKNSPFGVQYCFGVIVGRKDKLVLCYRLHELWCCFVFWLVSIYMYSQNGHQELEVIPQNHFLVLKSEHLEWVRTNRYAHIFPKGKPLGPYMVGRKYPIHPYIPTMFGEIINNHNQLIRRPPIRVLFEL